MNIQKMVCVGLCMAQMLLATPYKIDMKKDPNGYTYASVEGDPTALRIYTLKNGLTVYLSANPIQTKISTFVAVRTGSAYDPKDNTGLAHYLEHLLFKGTNNIATLDWSKESPMLEKISDAFERHKAEQDPERKKQIYAEIDSLSQEAAKYGIGREFDKSNAVLGGQRMNAHTYYDETVYKSIIPSNQLENWLYLERERFNALVLRFFHTELEIVYEEFNRSQDNSYRNQFFTALKLLCPVHPYGTQTTIGEGEHLKNPSMQAIHAYFNRYYVPSNMAVIMSGDLDYDKTIQLVDKYFGNMASKALQRPVLPVEKPLASVQTAEVFAQDDESVLMGFRLPGMGSKEQIYLQIIDRILSSNAGLLSLNVMQKQKALSAYSFTMPLRDYTFQFLQGAPKEGQTLEEVKDLLLTQLDKIKKGEFEDWLITAIAREYKINFLSQTKRNGWEDSEGRVELFFSHFINELNWQEQIGFAERMAKVSKAELVKFAQKYYANNYVLVYKRKGEQEVLRLDKPKITPVALNTDQQSAWYKDFVQRPNMGDLSPEFIDFKTRLHTDTLKEGVRFVFQADKSPQGKELFRLNYVFEQTKAHDKRIPLAFGYAAYLGTKKYSAEQFKKELYKLGLDVNFYAREHHSVVTLSGLSENFQKGVQILEDFLQNATVNQEAWQEYVKDILKARKNNLENKDAIAQALQAWVHYGMSSPFRDNLSNAELAALKPEELCGIIHNLVSYPHTIVYQGSSKEKVQALLASQVQKEPSVKPLPEAKKYQEQSYNKPKVFVAPYDMVQVILTWHAKDKDYNNLKDAAFVSLFNEYVGSWVFGEIREARSLAYTARLSFEKPSDTTKMAKIFGYVGTQADKLAQATQAMQDLFTQGIPNDVDNFERAKQKVIKTIQAERKQEEEIFSYYQTMKRQGIDHDIRQDIYEHIQNISLADFQKYFAQKVSKNTFVLGVLGDKNRLDEKTLQALGEVEHLDIKQLFNY